MRQLGLLWRRTATSAAGGAPPEVTAHWQAIMTHANTPVALVSTNDTLSDALVELCALADEASYGVGIPGTSRAQATGATKLQADAYDRFASLLLLRRSTLCKQVDASRIRVLPKLHTPQSGMTLRSLTHHLALSITGDLEAQWYQIPGGPEEHLGLNLLLLDKNQIIQYGLGSNLNHTKRWWEYISLRERTLAFIAVNPWLTMTVLICEDLARQDPVAELVRAVGPNLVLALLMDGPQLKPRWPARYATVLADDPGSSVLTLTSLGMAALCRPPGIQDASRIVALWKDAKTGGPYEIPLPQGADGLVLTLSAEFAEEWTADGRSDQGTTGYPILAGVYPVSVPQASG